jgi:hypothetical protein
MNRRRTVGPQKSTSLVNSLGLFILIGLAIIVAVGIGAGLLSSLPVSNGEQGNQTAAVLALAGSLAIGIERSLEVVWIFIGYKFGSGWPLGFLTKPIRDFKDQLENKEALPRYLEEANKILADWKEKSERTPEELDKLEKDLKLVNAQLASLGGLLLPNSSIEPVLQEFRNRLNDIQKTIVPTGHAILGVGKGSLDVLDNILGSFKDNPGKRLMSLFAGMIVGMIVCAVLSVDILYAIFGVAYSPFHLGIVATGIMVGLGADPSHQVIRLLEEAKGNFKGENAARGTGPAPIIPTPAGK